jgi:drug/metabolite transporter (DMT)-like permease
MMMMIATALVAAVLYGAGAAVEQRQAAAAPASSAGRPRLLFLLARQPLWLAGMAVQIGGFAAHAVSLRSGSLATVQMVMATELVVAVVIVRIWSGRPLSRASWAAALTVVASIAVFLGVTSSGHGHDHLVGHPDYVLATAVGAAATGCAALVAAVAGLRAVGRRRAVLLAVAAGLADSCSAVVTMAFSHVAGHGPAALFTSWTVYALIVAGAANVLLTQTAYQTGYPMVTLPIIASVTPVASVAIGIGLLGERLQTGVAGAIAAGLAVLVTSVALARLARSAPHPEPPNQQAPAQEPLPQVPLPQAPLPQESLARNPAADDEADDRVPALTGATSSW